MKDKRIDQYFAGGVWTEVQEFKDETFGDCIRQRRMTNGYIHDPDDEPAVTLWRPHSPLPLMREWYNAQGVLHRGNDLPARIITPYEPGAKEASGHIREEFYRRGVLHRGQDKPSELERIVHENVEYPLLRGWNKEGRPHRENNRPSGIRNYPDGSGLISWCFNGRSYRKNGLPSFIEYNSNKVVYYVEWPEPNDSKNKPVPVEVSCDSDKGEIIAIELSDNTYIEGEKLKDYSDLNFKQPYL